MARHRRTRPARNGRPGADPAGSTPAHDPDASGFSDLEKALLRLEFRNQALAAENARLRGADAENRRLRGQLKSAWGALAALLVLVEKGKPFSRDQ
jgi:hypothetical protein